MRTWRVRSGPPNHDRVTAEQWHQLGAKVARAWCKRALAERTLDVAHAWYDDDAANGGADDDTEGAEGGGGGAAAATSGGGDDAPKAAAPKEDPMTKTCAVRRALLGHRLEPTVTDISRRSRRFTVSGSTTSHTERRRLVSVLRRERPLD